MKKFIGILLISTFLLSACTIDWNNEKDAKIAELEKQISEAKKVDNLFQKKQDCLKYKSEIEKDLLDKQAKSEKWVYSLEQLFYSIPKNECYFVSAKETNQAVERWLYKYWNHSWYSKSEYACNYYFDDNFKKVDNWCDELDAKIQKLKWE